MRKRKHPDPEPDPDPPDPQHGHVPAGAELPDPVGGAGAWVVQDHGDLDPGPGQTGLLPGPQRFAAGQVNRSYVVFLLMDFMRLVLRVLN